LISGKNNVGKSSLLEAIGVYVDDSELFYVVEERGELPKYSSKDTTEYLKPNIEAISSLFTNRNTNVTEDNIIEISDNDDVLSLRYVYYTEQETEEDGNIVRKAIVFDSRDDVATGDAHLALEIIRKGKNKAIVPLERRLDTIRLGRTKKTDIASVIRVNPETFGNLYIGRLWDNVTLTEKEEYVIDALRIIEPNIESLAFLEESPRIGRYPVVKVKGVSKRLPLRSMGDGINHILSIIHGNAFEPKLTINTIAKMCFCSSSMVSHLFKKKSGITVNRYITNLRMKKAEELLNTTNLSVTEVAYSCGYTDSNYFVYAFGKAHGVPPLKYKKGIN
jgi:AraC-like DNA-binding protein